MDKNPEAQSGSRLAQGRLQQAAEQERVLRLSDLVFIGSVSSLRPQMLPDQNVIPL